MEIRKLFYQYRWIIISLIIILLGFFLYKVFSIKTESVIPENTKLQSVKEYEI